MGEAIQDSEPDADEILGTPDLHWRNRCAAERLLARDHQLSRDLRAGTLSAGCAYGFSHRGTNRSGIEGGGAGGTIFEAGLRAVSSVDIRQLPATDCGHVPASESLLR